MTDEVDRSAPVSFEQVARAPTLSDKVATMLLDTILAQRLLPGDRLPSERELGEQFGVSRTVIREAVRSLAAKGMLDVRTGSGLRVAAVDRSLVSETLNLFLHGRPDFDYAQVAEVRAMIEVQVAGLACERGTDEDFARLDRVCERMAEVVDDAAKAVLLDVEFHRAIAEATHNDFYVIMLDSIGSVLLEVRRRTAEAEPAILSDAVEYHRRIRDRILARDPAGAREAMKAHLHQIEHLMRHVVRDDDGNAVH